MRKAGSFKKIPIKSYDTWPEPLACRQSAPILLVTIEKHMSQNKLSGTYETKLK